MTLLEAMEQRHTVRRFTARPLEQEAQRLLTERIEENNAEHGLAMRLVTDDPAAFGPVQRLMSRESRSYILLAGPDGTGTEERLGWCSADLMLYAQTIGLNSWWVGGTYDHGAVERRWGAAGQEIIGIVVVGYGAEQGRPHRSKTAGQVSRYEGTAPDWFARGVRAALLAPTGLNRQAFTIGGRGDAVSVRYAAGPFSDADLGIVKYHFALGAGAENFRWG